MLPQIRLREEAEAPTDDEDEVDWADVVPRSVRTKRRCVERPDLGEVGFGECIADVVGPEAAAALAYLDDAGDEAEGGSESSEGDDDDDADGGSGSSGLEDAPVVDDPGATCKLMLFSVS